MQRQVVHIIESGKGDGKLYDHLNFLDDVTYRYQILQSVTIIEEDFLPSEEKPGPQEPEGEFSTVHYHEGLVGRTLRLETDRGKMLKVRIESFDARRKVYLFVGG
jgi:hypothetical protein